MGLGKCAYTIAACASRLLFRGTVLEQASLLVLAAVSRWNDCCFAETLVRYYFPEECAVFGSWRFGADNSTFVYPLISRARLISVNSGVSHCMAILPIGFASRIPVATPCLWQRKRNHVVALLRAQFAVATGSNDQILFALQRVSHRRGLSAGRQLILP